MQPLKKFEEVYEVPDNYLIRTPQGWKPVSKIMKTVPYDIWYIKLENGDDLKGADTHIVYRSINGIKTEVYLQDVVVGDLIETSEGYFKCIIREKLDAPPENMYDIEVNSDDHQFYANNISSHNTTCSALYILWYAIFNEDKTLGILANKERTAKSIVDEIKIAYLELPDWIKPGIEKWDQLEMKFENGSLIMAGATSVDSFRGESLSTIFLDEFAFVQPDSVAEAFFASVFPTISQGGKMIIVSTPNGAAGKFYDIFSNNERYGFKKIKVTWRDRPDRTEEWGEATKKILGKVKFLQEHEVSFQGSTNTLIEGNILSKIQTIDPIFMPEEGYVIWKRPASGRIYAIGVDVAKGANSDFSVMNIFDVTDKNHYEQVALYMRNDISIFDFKAKILQVAKYWNQAFVIIETNNLGSVIAKDMYFEDEYEHMYYDFDKGEYGVNANRETKPLALSYFKEDLETGKMLIYSREMLQQLNYFEEQKPGVFAARPGKSFHDDLVASGYWVSFALRSRSFEDYAYYRGQMNSKVNDSNNGAGNENDEDILNDFNKALRKPTDRDMLWRELAR